METSLLEMAKRRRVYAWQVVKRLEAVLPEGEIGAFQKVTGNIHAEPHEEPKEFFRSISRKYNAIQDHAAYPAFAAKVNSVLGKVVKPKGAVLDGMPDKEFVDYRQDPTKQVKVEATPRSGRGEGRKKRFKMQVQSKRMLNTMGRL